jgi:uncharacterized paraquat-inducible protein A
MMRKTRKILGMFALTISIVFFALGMYFPILSTHTRVVFRFGYEELNIFRSVAMFFEYKEYFLAAVILIFTFVMPVLKYVELVIRYLKGTASKMLQNLDKWNMLDVFLVALLLLNFKMNSGIIVMQLKIGTTFIALAVIFRIVTICLITNKTEGI